MQKEILYKELFEHSFNGIAVYKTTDSGKDFLLIDLNQAGEKISEIKKTDVIGKSVLKVFPGIKDLGLFGVFQSVYTTGRPEHHPIGQYKDDRLSQFVENFVFKLPTGEIVAVYRDESKFERVKEALQESEQWFRTLSESAFEAITIHDQSQIIQANDQFFKMFNYEPEELLGRNGIPLVVAPESIDLVRKNIKIGNSNPYEAFGLKKDGSKFPIEIHGKSVKHKDRFVRLTAIKDLTENKLAEKALRQCEENFKALANNAGNGILIVIDKGVILYANEKIAEMFGYSISELQKILIKDLIHPDVLLMIANKYKNTLQGKYVQMPYEAVAIRKDKKNVLIEITDAKIFWKGQPADIVIIRDITERKKRENALRASEEKYRSIIENIEDGCYEVDLFGNYTFLNDAMCKIRGYTHDELMGTNFRNYMSQAVAKKISKTFNMLYTTGDSVKNIEKENIKKDGTKIFLETSATLIKNSDGQAIGFRGVCRDVTERKLTERELIKKKSDLEKKNIRLEELNIALKVLLGKRDEDKSELDAKVLSNIKELVIPYLEKLNKSSLDARQQVFIEIIESTLHDIVSPFVNKLSSKYLNLTPAEIRIADLVKHGKTSKDIAALLYISEATVNFHRKNIRKKLGLKLNKANLRSHLLSLSQD